MALYQRLTLMEREELSRMLAAGYSLRATAQALQRAPSTVARPAGSVVWMVPGARRLDKARSSNVITQRSPIE